MMTRSALNPFNSMRGAEWTDDARSRATRLEARPGSSEDVSLEALSPEMEAALQSASGSWLTSLGFCTLYAFPSASHVRVCVDEASRVSKVCYYLERPWRGLSKKLHIFGPTELAPDQIRQLLRERRAALATITCMGSDDVNGWSGPWHHSSSAAVNEDVVVDLPRSEAQYLRSLGANARTQLPYYMRRLQKEWGDGLTVLYATGRNISKDVIAGLVELNRIRIERKGAVHLWHPQLVQKRWQLAQQCGLFCGVLQNGKLAAGTLSFLHRDHAYFVLIGHDTQFDRLRLGKLVLWLTIQRLIQTGFVRYHLLWGTSAYKYQLGGRPVTLSEVTVFRDPWVAAVWHADKGIEAASHLAKRAARIPAAIPRRISALLRSRLMNGGER